jgi:hypothetical protein
LGDSKSLGQNGKRAVFLELVMDAIEVGASESAKGAAHTSLGHIQSQPL